MRAVASKNRARAVARTEALLLVGLLVFVAIVAAAQKLLGFGPIHLAAPAALAFLLVPALLWLGYFYLQDRHEPEPKHYVFGVYLLGAFVAFPVARFFAALFPVEAWAGEQLSFHTVFSAIIPLGLAQEFAKYLVVRYTVCLSNEFDEPMDGIIYMTAAGIGFATAENLYALEQMGGTIHLAAFVMNAVVTTLAHGSIAGVLGYALGLARFSPPARRGPLILLGMLLAATLNGVFGLLQALVRVSGMQVIPWRGVAFAAVFAACVFGGTLALMRRHLLARSPWHA
jgi:RsiW-degrading membrane proteinase PrsW (M82 family)